jgi:hypothetical protein
MRVGMAEGQVVSVRGRGPAALQHLEIPEVRPDSDRQLCGSPRTHPNLQSSAGGRLVAGRPASILGREGGEDD